MTVLPRITTAALLLAYLAIPSQARAESFQRSLNLQGVTFGVQATGEGSQQQLTITTRGSARPIGPIKETVDGRVLDAQVADLDANGQPEIYVVVQGAGSGSYGQLVAYALSGGKRFISPIVLQELSGSLAQGYQGHDQFEVVENCLVRRFPIYKPGDSNAKATGGLRQICYKLKPGEASWMLRPTSVLKF